MGRLEWLVLMVLASPVFALAALVIAFRLRRRLRLLEARILALETAAGRQPEAVEVNLPDGAATASILPVEAPVTAHDPEASAGHEHVATASRHMPHRIALRGGFSGFEERIGARWAVWVGGLALALGGMFLVRYAVEQNLIGPAGRVGLGLLLALALLTAGEALRRLDRRQGFESLSVASVPSLLTAVGIMTAFGSLYAAHALYHLIAPGATFALLGLTSAAGVLAALRHGPTLAALGFAGAATTPLLVGAREADAWGVALLIAMAGVAALTVARLRRWRWFAWLALIGMGGWGATLLVFDLPQAPTASGALALVLLAATAVLLTPGHLLGPRDAADGQPDPTALLGTALALAVAALAAATDGVEAGSLAVFVLAATGTLALAWRAPSATLAAPAVALAAPTLLLAWRFPRPSAAAVGVPSATFIVYALAMSVLIAGIGFAGASGARRRCIALGWAAAGALGPVLLLAAAYARLALFDRSLPFALLALGLAAVFTAAAEALARRQRIHAAAAFAAGGVVSLALAFAFALEKGWLTISLALSALGIAWVSTLRPLPGLRQLAAGLAVVVLIRFGWAPDIAGPDIGLLPRLNWLAWGYGLPAFAFAGAARLLAPGGDDGSRKVLEAAALVSALLLVTFEVRAVAHGGDLLTADTRLFETGLLATLYGAYAVGLARLAATTGRALYRWFSDLVAVLAALLALDGLIEGNPFLTGEKLGGPIVNDLLAAYGLPAALAVLYAAVQPMERRRTRAAAGALAVVLALAYATFQVSRMFQGPILSAEAITAMEWYAYSATWLGFGIVLLALGLARRSHALRLAAVAVMAATVLKVFLSDMADLDGMLRALSFIGLGLALVAMGWLYQRLLARRTSE